jgi:hypothetical protein
MCPLLETKRDRARRNRARGKVPGQYTDFRRIAQIHRVEPIRACALAGVGG